MILTTLRSIGQGFYKMSLNWDLYIRLKVMGLGRRQSAIFISSYQGYLPSGWYHFFFFFLDLQFFSGCIYLFIGHTSQHVGSKFPKQGSNLCLLQSPNYWTPPGKSQDYLSLLMGNLNHQNEVALVRFHCEITLFLLLSIFYS